MKICIALARTIVLGGDARSTHNLAAKLEENGFDVSLIMPKVSYAVPHEKTYYLPFSWTTMKSPITLTVFIRTVKRFSRTMDVVQCNLPVPSFGFVSDMIAKDNKTPVVTAFGTPLIERSEFSSEHLKSAFPHYFVRFCFNNRRAARTLNRFRSKRYIVSTDYQKKQLTGMGLGPKKIEVIPNIVDVGANSRFSKKRSREEFGFREKNIITYIGHLTPSKGTDFLIKAIPDVLKQHPDTRLVIAWSGSGTDKRTVGLVKELGLQKNVTLLGDVDVPKLLSATDVFVLPYLFNFGTNLYPSILLEAMSIGVPIVTSRLDVFRGLLRHRSSAMLTEPADADGISDAVIELISDKEMQKRMILKQNEIMRKNLNPDRLVKRYIRLYEDVVK